MQAQQMQAVYDGAGDQQQNAYRMMGQQAQPQHGAQPATQQQMAAMFGGAGGGAGGIYQMSPQQFSQQMQGGGMRILQPQESSGAGVSGMAIGGDMGGAQNQM